MNTQRRFIIGDEWLYLKIYSGPKMIEHLLTHEIYESVKHFYAEGIIDNFFFTRYMDSEYHIRLRFHLIDVSKLSIVLERLNRDLKKYVNNRMIAQITSDTYNRELERYGTLSIAYIETIFSVNSWQVLEIYKETTDYTERWLKGISIMDLVLDKFNISTSRKYNIHENYYQMYAEEFKVAQIAKEPLKRKYREVSKNMEAAIVNDKPMHFDTPFNIYAKLDAATTAIVELQNEGSLEVPLDGLLKSVMHMHYNRLFTVRHRFHELVIYYMLSNLYKSLSIREANISKPAG